LCRIAQSLQEELNTPQTQNEDDLRTTYLRSQWAKEVQGLEAQIGIQALKLQEQAVSVALKDLVSIAQESIRRT